MSKTLVQRLREVTAFLRFETGDRVAAASSLSEEAADRIEALEAEVSQRHERMSEWRDDMENAPRDGTMFVVIGVTKGNGFTGGRPYTSDPWVVWSGEDGTFHRWPHNWPPTHWSPLDPPPDPPQ